METIVKLAITAVQISLHYAEVIMIFILLYSKWKIELMQLSVISTCCSGNTKTTNKEISMVKTACDASEMRALQALLRTLSLVPRVSNQALA